MKEIYYTYNNEAIASCVMLQALKHVKSIDIARACLILPLLLDDRTVSYLKQQKSNEIKLNDLVNSRPKLFTTINRRFNALLPVTINTLMILRKSNQATLSKTLTLQIETLPNDIEIGDRFNEIRNVIPILMDIFDKHTTLELYKILRIQL